MDHPPETYTQDTYLQVEAVLDKKIIRGVRYYLIKWFGYSDGHNTWVPESNLDFDNDPVLEMFQWEEIVDEYLMENYDREVRKYLKKHDDQIRSVLGVCEKGNVLHFIVKSSSNKTVLIPIRQAQELFPKLALEFFEKRLRWKHITNKQSVSDEEVQRMREKTGNFSGGFDRGYKLESVMGVINAQEGLLVLIKWEGRDCIELVPAATVHENCPQLLIDFYFERTEWTEPE